MPGSDWWDVETIEENAAGMDKVYAKEREAFLWLLKSFRGHNLWMDGTMHWTLPVGTLSGIRAKTALEAILEAKKRYEAKYGGDHAARSETLPGAVPAGEMRPGTSSGDAGSSVPGVDPTPEVRSS